MHFCKALSWKSLGIKASAKCINVKCKCNYHTKHGQREQVQHPPTTNNCNSLSWFSSVCLQTAIVWVYTEVIKSLGLFGEGVVFQVSVNLLLTVFSVSDRVTPLPTYVSRGVVSVDAASKSELFMLHSLVVHQLLFKLFYSIFGKICFEMLKYHASQCHVSEAPCVPAFWPGCYSCKSKRFFFRQNRFSRVFKCRKRTQR